MRRPMLTARGELTALRVRYEGLVKIADEAQARSTDCRPRNTSGKYYR